MELASGGPRMHTGRGGRCSEVISPPQALFANNALMAGNYQTCFCILASKVSPLIHHQAHIKCLLCTHIAKTYISLSLFIQVPKRKVSHSKTPHLDIPIANFRFFLAGLSQFHANFL
jgi:hypothetical protein